MRKGAMLLTSRAFHCCTSLKKSNFRALRSKQNFSKKMKKRAASESRMHFLSRLLPAYGFV